MEHQRIDDLERERVFLLEERLDEDITRPSGVGVRRHLLGGDFTEAVERGGGVEDRDGDFGDDGGDDDGVALGAGSVCEHGEDDAFEEGAGLVEGFLERAVQVYVELMGFLDVVLYSGEEDGVEEDLCGLRLRGDEDAGRGEHGVGCPVLWACDAEECLPGGNCGEDLEGFGELAGLVAAHDQADF